MELLERQDALDSLLRWAGSLRATGGCVVLVGAAAGLGKTALLRAFARQIGDVPALWGACDALFTPRPLAPLLDIARQARGPLRRALAEQADRDALFAATLDEFESAPAVILFEDLHWADEATLDFLKFFGRRIARTQALLVVTYRDDEVGIGHPLQFAIGDLPRASTHRLHLEPFSELAVATLERRSGRTVPDLHRLTAGNPLFVTEVLAAGNETVPPTIRDTVMGRVVRLPAGARNVAQIACLVPSRTEAWLIEALAAPTSEDLDKCLAFGMQRNDEGALAFRHELVRRALEEALTPGQRRELHADILAALATRGDVAPARLAHHAAGAEDGTALLQYAPLAAAQAAALGAHREAVAHYARALRHAGALDAAGQALLHEKLAYEYYLTDQVGRALEERRAALALWSKLGRRDREGDTQRWLSRLSWFAGNRQDAERYASLAVATLEPLAPGRELALAYSNRAQLDMLAYRTEPAVEWATRAIELAQRFDDDEVLSHALNNRGAARLLVDDERGRPDLEAALDLALRGNMHEHAARAYTNLSSSAVSCRQYETARRYLELGLDYCEQLDLDAWRLYMLAWRARCRFECGDWQGAGDDAEAVVAHPGTSAVARMPALVVLGHLRTRRGDPDAATPLRAAGELARAAQEAQRTVPLVAALAEAAWLGGSLEPVLEELRAAYALVCSHPNPWGLGEIAAWLRRAGEPVDVSRMMAEPYVLELAGRGREAADLWNRLGCPYERAWRLAWYGDQNDQREALEIFESLGAEPAARHLRRAMRAAGIRGVPRGQRSSTRGNPHGLTRREAQILELMQAGLRNSAIARKLFLSTRTVDHHVSAVLGKLGATTRAEAVAIAVRTIDQD